MISKKIHPGFAMKNSAKPLNTRYFSGGQMAWYSAIALVFTIAFHLLFPGHRVAYLGSYLLHFCMDMVLNFMLVSSIWVTNAIVNSKLDIHSRWEAAPVQRIFLQIGVNTIFSTVIILFLVTGYSTLISVLFPGPFLVTQASESNSVWKNAVVVLPVIFIIYQILYLGTYFFRQWRNTLIETERLKQENLNSQLLALRNQVNPHFLFNSLSSLSSLISEDSGRAIDFVQELAAVYRYLLQKHETMLSRLDDEIRVVNSFIYLHQVRFDDNLAVSIAIAPEYNDWLLPPTALLILFENAIQHNIISAEQPLHISLCTRNNTICIENNLQIKRSRESSGTGLNNIKERYRLTGFPSVFIEKTDDIFRVTLPLIPPKGVYEHRNY